VIKQKNWGENFLHKTSAKKQLLLIKKIAVAVNVVDFETAIKYTAQKPPHKIRKTVKPPGSPGGLIIESISFENEFSESLRLP